MKTFKLLGFSLLSILLVNILLQGSKSQALSQTGDVNINISGMGCNSSIDFNPSTQIITLKPGMRLSANKSLNRIVCVLRISTPTSDKILVPLSVKGSIRNYGGTMSVAITTNSGANVLSRIEKDYTRSGNIDLANLFSTSGIDQCGSSNTVGANINVFGTKGSIDLNDIRFRLQSKKC
jgi:hypothetical protein